MIRGQRASSSAVTELGGGLARSGVKYRGIYIHTSDLVVLALDLDMQGPLPSRSGTQRTVRARTSRAMGEGCPGEDFESKKFESKHFESKGEERHAKDCESKRLREQGL